ncbi:MAG: hypothetical protein ABIB72_00210 [Candidatus Falkowbacteria bacterium]
MCFAEIIDEQGRIHSADYFEGLDGEEEEIALSGWDKHNMDKQRICWISKKQSNKFCFVVEFILKEE